MNFVACQTPNRHARFLIPVKQKKKKRVLYVAILVSLAPCCVEYDCTPMCSSHNVSFPAGDAESGA